NPARAGPRQLLRRDHAKQHIDGRPAIFLGKTHAKETNRRRFPVKLAREAASLVPLIHIRHDLLIDESADGLTPGPVILGVVRALIAVVKVKRIGAVGKDGGHFYPSLLFLLKYFYAD